MAEYHYHCSEDGWVSDGGPNTNYVALDYIRVGDGSSTASVITHLFFKFTGHLALPTNAIVNSCQIRLAQSDKNWYAETSSASNLRPCSASWSESTITYNNMPATGATVASITRLSSDAVGYYYLEDTDLTALIQAEIAAGAVGHGYRLGGLSVTPASHRNATMYYSKRYGTDDFSATLLLDVTIPGEPTLTTDAATSVAATTVTLNGTVDSDGDGTITERGFYWKTAVGGTVTKQAAAGTSEGAYSYDLTGLTDGTQYMYYAYATNENGTGYGSATIKYFTTTAVASTPGAGGEGLPYSLTGTEKIYGSGGGGGAVTGAGSAGGTNAGSGGTTGAGSAATAGYGGGGGGGSFTGDGGAGSRGVVVVRYLTADAIASSPTLTADTFIPSIAYHSGKLITPYSVSDDAVSLTISGITVHSTAPVITTVAHHEITNGTIVSITGTTECNGSWVATSTGDHTFTIPTETTETDDAGTVIYNESVGIERTGVDFPDRGWLTQSKTTYHTGSMLKDFQYFSVSHDALSDGQAIDMSWTIDGTSVNGTPEAYSDTVTRFAVGTQGYEVESTIGITPNDNLTLAPKVRNINILWNFIQGQLHLYYLSCIKGAGDGKWSSNPKEAITFLFTTASKRAEFEDRFFGEYDGVIDRVSFNQAPESLEEGPSGTVELLVREVK